jgi:hypothetical protein|tara:strand:- start:330 stop:494 length:165 start_codon:yes stop_codon:yes gene_type:complete
MSEADRMGDMPTRDTDIGQVEAKTLNENDDDDDDDEDNDGDNYTTLRKSCAFTI